MKHRWTDNALASVGCGAGTCMGIVELFMHLVQLPTSNFSAWSAVPMGVSSEQYSTSKSSHMPIWSDSASTVTVYINLLRDMQGVTDMLQLYR